MSLTIVRSNSCYTNSNMSNRYTIQYCGKTSPQSAYRLPDPLHKGAFAPTLLHKRNACISHQWLVQASFIFRAFYRGFSPDMKLEEHIISYPTDRSSERAKEAECV